MSGDTVEVNVVGGVDVVTVIDRGPKGDMGTVSIGTVTSGAAGSEAAVVNVGTSSTAVLNFTIPRGDVGPTGPTGATGTAFDPTDANSILALRWFS